MPMTNEEIKEKQKELDELYAMLPQKTRLTIVSKIVELELEIEAECN